MTDFYRTKRFNVDPSTFGGVIDIEDFNTNSPNKKRISNQIDAMNLKTTIEKQNMKKDKEKEYKNMTLEELRELRLISNTDGRPTSYMTDEKWQKEFNLRKLFITPYPNNIKKLKGQCSKESGKWNNETMGMYCGCTSWQSYCSYINDVLNNIRAGQVDYCYFIFQIIDLLKFHYNDLRTKYCDGYWQVWLERQD